MPSSQHQQDAILKADFLDNTGGINVTDTPFKVQDSQCLESYNFDYISTGGIRKRQGIVKQNSSPDAVLNSLGLFMYVDPSSNKTILRATDSKLQALDASLYTSTNLTDDTSSAASTPFTSGSTVSVNFSQFNTAGADDLTGTGNTAWMTGGGLSAITGAYSTTKYTTNGAIVPTGSITAGDGGGSGSTLSTNTYFWAVAGYKASTQVTSNLALDASGSITSGHNATVTLSSVVLSDYTKYTQFWLYRSAAAGVTGFTTGDLVAKIAYDGVTFSIASGGGSITSGGVYTDTGSSIASTINLPRAGNTIIDHSVLPTGTYKTLTTFKRRLVTSKGSKVYLSALNKPESWPTGNVITVPSGGEITGLAIIYFSSPTTASNDEYLVIFKEREIWVITGESLASSTSDVNTSWKLKMVDNVGCPAQSLIISLNGFLAWIDYRGVYLWDGSASPIYCSRPLESIFQDDGDLDKSKFTQGNGVYYRKYNQLVWFLSSRSKGTNMFALRMDLRLTLPSVSAGIDGKTLDGVFTWDYIATGITGPIGACFAGVLPGLNDEYLIIGDNTGYVYQMYRGYADVAGGPQFTYTTKFLDFGLPGIVKRIHKVIVYVTDLGNYNLTLNYWADYRTALSNMSTKQVLISATNSTSDTALWDVGFWDVAYWDNYTPATKSITFNLSSESNNCEGDALKLQFQQTSANQPVTILGYSILYSVLGARK